MKESRLEGYIYGVYGIDRDSFTELVDLSCKRTYSFDYKGSRYNTVFSLFLDNIYNHSFECVQFNQEKLIPNMDYSTTTNTFEPNMFHVGKALHFYKIDTSQDKHNLWVISNIKRAEDLLLALQECHKASVVC